MVKQNRGLHLVKARNEDLTHPGNRFAGFAGLTLRHSARPVPLEIRMRWYLSLRYWRQACAICFVNAATFILWQIAVR